MFAWRQKKKVLQSPNFDAFPLIGFNNQRKLPTEWLSQNLNLTFQLNHGYQIIITTTYIADTLHLENGAEINLMDLWILNSYKNILWPKDPFNFKWLMNLQRGLSPMFSSPSVLNRKFSTSLRRYTQYQVITAPCWLKNCLAFFWDIYYI